MAEPIERRSETLDAKTKTWRSQMRAITVGIVVVVILVAAIVAGIGGSSTRDIRAILERQAASTRFQQCRAEADVNFQHALTDVIATGVVRDSAGLHAAVDGL